MATINPTSWLVLSLLCGAALGQLSFHNDPSQNSFSIKLPAFQQTFTRYFGNQPHGALLQQQHQPQQQQPFQTAGSSNLVGQAQTYQLQQPAQQRQQQRQQPETINRYVAKFSEQPHYTVQENYINPNIRQRIQQQRLQQQQQQFQPQQYYSQPTNYQGFPLEASQPAQDTSVYAGGNQQPQYEYIQQPSAPESGNAGFQDQQQPQQQPSVGVQFLSSGFTGQRTQGPAPAGGPTDPVSPGKLIGVAFSPSNEVSQVKFSSNGLKYNF